MMRFFRSTEATPAEPAAKPEPTPMALVYVGPATVVWGYTLTRRSGGARSGRAFDGYTLSVQEACAYIDKAEGRYAALVKLWQLSDGRLVTQDPATAAVPLARLYKGPQS